MLKKLLKYDLWRVYKVLIIFYSLTLVFAVMTRIFFTIENSFVIGVIAQICNGAFISMMINVIINNTIRQWVEFKNNLYGDESYLTHTLPVKKQTVYMSKSLSSLLSMLTSIVVILISVFIAYYSKENFEMVKALLLPIADAYDSSVVPFIIVIFLVLFLELANAVQCGYTGILLGHKAESGKTLLSVLFGFIVYSASQTAVLSMVFMAGLFDKSIMDLFFTDTFESIVTIKTIVVLSLVAYTVLLVALYFINAKIFRKGVNVD